MTHPAEEQTRRTCRNLSLVSGQLSCKLHLAGHIALVITSTPICLMRGFYDTINVQCIFLDVDFRQIQLHSGLSSLSVVMVSSGAPWWPVLAVYARYYLLIGVILSSGIFKWELCYWDMVLLLNIVSSLTAVLQHC